MNSNADNNKESTSIECETSNEEKIDVSEDGAKQMEDGTSSKATSIEDVRNIVDKNTGRESEMDCNDSSSLVVEGSESFSAETLAEEPRQEKLTRFPMGRIKHIMKMDPDVKVVTPEATFLVSKSLELFVESLVWEAHRYTEQSRKKTMGKTDVERAIDGVDALAFLEGALDD